MNGKKAKERLNSQYKRQNDYIKENYDRVSITLPKGTKERINILTGKSCNAYISALVLADLERMEALEKKQPEMAGHEPEAKQPEVDGLPFPEIE